MVLVSNKDYKEERPLHLRTKAHIGGALIIKCFLLVASVIDDL